MEVEKKGGGSFPSNYLTIQQLRQRWLQQQQSSSSSSLSSSPVVISESNHRDNDDDVECCAASSSKKKPQNDAFSPPVVTKSLSYNNNNKASSSLSKPNQLPTLSPITSSGGSMKKPQNDAVSPPPPPAKAKSPPPPAKEKSPPPPAKTESSSSSSSNNNNNKAPLISEQKHDNVIVSSKTLNQSVGASHYKRGGGRNPNRLLAPQKPKPEPKNTATSLNTDDDSAANDDVDNHINTNNNKKISKRKKSGKAKRVFPVSGPETDPKLEPEVEVEAVVVKDKEESRRRRKSDKKEPNRGLEVEVEVEVEVEKKRDNKVGRDFKDKRASSFHQNNKNDAFAVEPEKLEMEMKTVMDKRQKPPRNLRGRRDLDNKAVWEFKPKTTFFGQCNNDSNLVDDNVDVKAVEVDKVVGNGDVDADIVKENSRRGSRKYGHRGQGQGKQTLKATSSFDDHQGVSETTTIKESEFANNSYATVDGERRVFGRFHRQGIRRPLPETEKGKVWVKKTPTPT